ncbi:L-2-hydroxyglutarate oxidase [Allosalinactinospora lopnorensis]|uniref:L-2-hydroxyglutarate oxidase n=1 Tax=Allosalinactinospora lopnorensis TaxID=1352348 RepID=UPI000623CC53|nr:L-2-hydroxyglutarate oxidase [Allosalinactinospora lopnorensis]
MTRQRCAVIGGGIIGSAVARRLLQVRPDAAVTLIEKEPSVGTHQSGRNSGVVHAGLYYRPGSLKATLCRRGVRLLREFCEEHAISYVECGKVLVALDERERSRLSDIADRAHANGVPGVRVLDAAELREIEPGTAGIAGLHSPSTAIADFAAVTRYLAADVEDRGGTVRTGCEVTALRESGEEVVVEAANGYREAFDLVVVCAGLHSDRVARLAGAPADPSIVPFRGEYYALRQHRRSLVNGLVYPVPDPRYPFLGVHVTPRVDGSVLIGPNAILATAREGYRRRDIDRREIMETLRRLGFPTLAARHWRTGVTEMAGSLSTRVFVSRARRYLPGLRTSDVVPAPSGVRAQALGADGSLLDDFRINRRGRTICVRNAPSPAATSSLAIAEHIVGLALGEKTHGGPAPADREEQGENTR